MSNFCCPPAEPGDYLVYLFLPPYSPDYNPIELLWAFVKSVLRKLKARTHQKLNNAINFALGKVSADYIKNWFDHCGYIS
jgi:transposase